MDLSKLTKADKILFGAGLVFLISTFLPWFSVDFGVAEASWNGWDAGFLWGGVTFFVVLAMLVWVGLRRFSSTKLPAELPPLYLAGGVGVALLVILKLLIGENDPDRPLLGPVPRRDRRHRRRVRWLPQVPGGWRRPGHAEGPDEGQGERARRQEVAEVRHRDAATRNGAGGVHG